MRNARAARPAVAFALLGCLALSSTGDLPLRSIAGHLQSILRRLAENIVEREYACAAFSVCGDPCDETRADTCTEAIEECDGKVDRIEGPIGSSLAVLSSNPSYRVKDILNGGGLRYRLDSMTILAEPRYRGTLLRETLVRTATWDQWGNGTNASLEHMPPEEVEEIVRTRSDAEGQPPGTAYLEGRTGGNGIILARSRENYRTFAALLLEMYNEGKCEGVVASASNDNNEPPPLIVGFRMGDSGAFSKKVAQDFASKITEELTAEIADEEELGEDPKNERIRVQTRRRRVIIRGVLHYGNNCLKGLYARSQAEDEKNVETLSTFVEDLEEGGFDVDIVSSPSADQDICAFVFGQTPKAIPDQNQNRRVPRGFYGFVRVMRDLVGEARQSMSDVPDTSTA